MAKSGPRKARFGLKNPQLKDFGWILAVLELARSSIHFNTGGVNRNRERVWYFEDKHMVFLHMIHKGHILPLIWVLSGTCVSCLYKPLPMYEKKEYSHIK